MRTSSSSPRLRWPRLVGGTLIATALLGVLISLAGMIVVAQAGATAQQALIRELMTLDRALVATGEGLTIAGGALTDVEGTLGSLSATLVSATQAISETQPTLATIGDLTGTSLPQTIRETQVALASAQTAAVSAEDVLSSLRFLGVRYSPEVPLAEAIGGVGASLADIPGDLAEVAAGLDDASANLEQLTGNLAQVATGIDAIAGSVDQATGVVEQYQEIVGDLRTEVASIGEALPGWINIARWGLWLALVWMALAQIGLLAQGWAMIQGDTVTR